MTQHFVLYQHAGSGNHGCEALVRTVIDTIRAIRPDARFTLVTSNIAADRQYGLDAVPGLALLELNKPIKKGNLNWFVLQLGKLLRSEKIKRSASFHTKWMNWDATFIAIGGDNYCYNKGRGFYSVDNAIEGRKILWGCSVEPEDLDEELVTHLQQFDVITAREPISLNAMKRAGLTQTVYAPDTAFALPVGEIGNREEKRYIGINISPMILNFAKNADAVVKNYQNLIRHIVDETDMDILFVPHVVSEQNDDRLAIQALVEQANIPDNRYRIVSDQNCMNIKAEIGLCDFFIGARTHSTIAAYSQYIPTLVMGYSVKSVGIAQDLFGSWEKYVIPVNTLEDTNALLTAFGWLEDNQNSMRSALEQKVPVLQKQILDSYRQII